MGTPREDYENAQKMIARSERLKDLAKKHGGKVIVSNGKSIIHINSSCYVTEDGTKVYEW